MSLVWCLSELHNLLLRKSRNDVKAICVKLWSNEAMWLVCTAGRHAMWVDKSSHMSYRFLCCTTKTFMSPVLELQDVYVLQSRYVVELDLHFYTNQYTMHIIICRGWRKKRPYIFSHSSLHFTLFVHDVFSQLLYVSIKISATPAGIGKNADVRTLKGLK